MDTSSQSATLSEPPLSSVEAFYPSYAFGYGTGRYWLLVEALAEGLAEYEAQQVRKGQHAYTTTPLPAA